MVGESIPADRGRPVQAKVSRSGSSTVKHEAEWSDGRILYSQKCADQRMEDSATHASDRRNVPWKSKLVAAESRDSVKANDTCQGDVPRRHCLRHPVRLQDLTPIS